MVVVWLVAFSRPISFRDLRYDVETLLLVPSLSLGRTS
jgi:hypothetical protein